MEYGNNSMNKFVKFKLFKKLSIIFSVLSLIFLFFIYSSIGVFLFCVSLLCFIIFLILMIVNKESVQERKEREQAEREEQIESKIKLLQPLIATCNSYIPQVSNLSLESYSISLVGKKIVFGNQKNYSGNIDEYKNTIIFYKNFFEVHDNFSSFTVFYNSIISLSIDKSSYGAILIHIYCYGGEFYGRSDKYIHSRELDNIEIEFEYADRAEEIWMIIKNIEELALQNKLKERENIMRRIENLPMYLVIPNQTQDIINSLEDMPEIHIARVNKSFNKDFLTSFVTICIETTGLDPDLGDEIIELSAIKYINNKPKEKFYTLICPKTKNNSVAEINGITIDMLVNAYSISSVRQSFEDFVGDNPIVGYNIIFVLKFLFVYGFNALFTTRRKYFDVYQYVRGLDNYDFGGDYKLNNVCAMFQIQILENRSLYKCYAIGELFDDVLEVIGKTE